MKSVYSLILLFLALCSTSSTQARSKSFTDMTEAEKSAFIAVKIDEITVKISGKKYAFDPAFQSLVRKQLDSYINRAGNNIKNKPFGEDLNFVIERGAAYAPAINAVFDKNGVSRLSGLYMAMIESEFNNQLLGPTGSSGAFALTAAQAKKFGMGKKDLANLSNSAGIAARLIIEDQKKFESDKMKEFLAILSHDRDSRKISYDVNRMIMDDYRACSICGLTKIAATLDRQFQMEAVKYIPKFLAAAIIGENPEDFGLSTKPLSTLALGTS